MFKVNHGNTMVFDGFGPHERLGFALRTIDDVVDGPEEAWDPSHHVGPIFWTFPGFSIAGGWRQRMTVALCLPTTKVDESITEHRIVVRHAIDDTVQHDLEVMRDWFYDVVYNEDYLTQYGVQTGVASHRWAHADLRPQRDRRAVPAPDDQPAHRREPRGGLRPAPDDRRRLVRVH